MSSFLSVINSGCGHTQALTPDMLAPAKDGFAPRADSPLRKVADSQTPNGAAQSSSASSRVGQLPSYDIPAASGAGDTGYDSLNRVRKKRKPYPGEPKPKFVGPGNSPNQALQAPRVTPPVSPSFAGTADGQPARRKLKVDDDPFGQVGFYAGSFLVKSAVEVMGGYDTNPARFEPAKGSAFYMISPEFTASTDWTRHSVVADLRGSFTGYGTNFPGTVDCNCNPPQPVASPVPENIDRPDFTAKIDGRLDVSRDTRVNSELRLHVGTDNPGSPNIQVGLTKYPIFTTSGATLGLEQDFNRFQLQANGNVDHTAYQNSQLTDGTTSSNDDRNFNQYGGQARVSYDLMPGLKPFGEIEADTRVHEVNVDRYGYQRDSNGGYAKAGTTFEFSRLLTGEFALGYAMRNYQDPRLTKLEGLLTSASLVWTATGLTTVRFNSTSSIDETTLAGVSGSLSRDYVVQVDHAFRRWLIGTAKIGYGTTDYQGARFDNRYFVEGDLIYKLNRTFAIKGSVRRDWLDSDVPGASSSGTVVMLGIRVQR